MNHGDDGGGEQGAAKPPMTPREELHGGAPHPAEWLPEPHAADAATRRRIRRFGWALLAVIVALVLFTIGYVELFDHVLRDPEHAPTVTSATSPRVLLFEFLLVGAAIVTAGVVWLVRRRRQGPR